MLEKSKRHANKVLIFFMNVLLMVVAILVIKQKEDSKRQDGAQNELEKENSSLANENLKLKNDLETLKGSLGNLESGAAIEENSVSPLNLSPSGAASSVNAGSGPAVPVVPPSNSTTKTS
jgi:hypothetical protein